MDRTIRIRRFDDLEAYRRRVDPFLRAREAEHSLLLGILTGLQRGRRYAAPPLLVCAEEGGEVTAVALRTPPFHLVLSLAEAHVLDALADGLAHEDLSGVNGPRLGAEAFARRYLAPRGMQAREVTALGLYRLDEVAPIAVPEGAYRELEERDREQAARFVGAFHVEAHATPAVAPEALIDEALGGRVRGMAVWEAGGALVSLTGWSQATSRSDRIGPVYTPPAQRGRGYASALVAEVSRRRLERGAEFCTLYTDLANPTSNSIYQRIGYRRLLDAVELEFEPPATA